ncbi:MAG: PRC-barrel domain-containing protein [Desulfobacterales bacterium]
MKRSATIMTALFSMLLFSGMVVVAGAQQSTVPGASERLPSDSGVMQSEKQEMAIPRASKIIGLDVKGSDDQKLGEVNDLIIGDNGLIEFVVISEGGVLGVGENLIAVPWDAASARFEGNALRVGLNPDEFASAPTFSSWDEFEEGDYEQTVRGYFGTESRGEDANPAEMTPGRDENPTEMTPGSESSVPGSESESDTGSKQY